ncbi:hypothetical protein FVEG_05175 [Fusarium verticillioides 7600]|uniref:Uncharacterized protein n=1 Tax=Gibberella moniliformis (strain M3125 / FGSC 7600) TaxID=334819 RepID=W7M8P7_GIBM7|nr:hypothetical protein FVEG_05175 [Fusarium verticillioides 7600]EWG43915.1 hypothetical protein FVEG_05175 [Fusarium verticillioides 7600]
MRLALLAKAQREAYKNYFFAFPLITNGLSGNSMLSTKQIQLRRYRGVLCKEDIEELNGFIKGEIRERTRR